MARKPHILFLARVEDDAAVRYFLVTATDATKAENLLADFISADGRDPDSPVSPDALQLDELTMAAKAAGVEEITNVVEGWRGRDLS